jgi:hypothetical protein
MDRTRFTNAFLDGLRQEESPDPDADAAVAAIYAGGRQGLDRVNRLLVQLTENDDPPPADLPAPVREYFDRSAVLPDWADERQIELAQHLFSRHGILGTAILCCASLPECYLDVEGVPVLASTQNLEAHVFRRIWETSHMVISVMRPGGLERTQRSAGIVSCQRVRLMHAAIRHLLLAAPTDLGAPGQLGDRMAQQPWDLQRLGVPLNQEDLAFVLLTFSYVGLRGLDTMHADVTPEERDAYLHAWNVVGHVMGIRRELMAETYHDAEWLFGTIKARHRGASPDGQALTAALVKWMADTMPPLLGHLPRTLICELIGKEDAALLGVRLSVLERVGEELVSDALRAMADFADEAYRDAPWTRRAAELLFRRIVKRLWNMERGWNRELFAIPPELQQSWRVTA